MICCMHNLTITLGDQGKLNEADGMQQEVLEKRQRILGDEHLDTNFVMNNLAVTPSDQENPDEAADMHQECSRSRCASPEASILA
ncbi:hypothetical protein V490_00055 [Pseudogymnoascus sp. VKM F-3557]|nr:hypothetical protein V490_00055 [Pseudogymnoascus sp. VKM F-3557]